MERDKVKSTHVHITYVPVCPSTVFFFERYLFPFKYFVEGTPVVPLSVVTTVNVFICRALMSIILFYAFKVVHIKVSNQNSLQIEAFKKN